jgi:ABC-type nitrate/sulfonate/bicarbonate transport system substrate-binding protein
MLAEAEDLFEKANANVKFFKFDSAKSTRDAMISGHIDIGTIGAAKRQMETIGSAL